MNILIKDFLIHSSVILEHEGIVWIGYDKDVEDASRHDIHERHVLQIELIPFLWYLGFHNLFVFNYVILPIYRISVCKGTLFFRITLRLYGYLVLKRFNY